MKIALNAKDAAQFRRLAARDQGARRAMQDLTDIYEANVRAMQTFWQQLGEKHKLDFEQYEYGVVDGNIVVTRIIPKPGEAPQS